MNILLLGGSGFLGSGVREQLAAKQLSVKSLDISDVDLASSSAVASLVAELEDADCVAVLAAKLGIKLFAKSPVSAATANHTIDQNVLASLKAASKKYSKKYNVTYFSSSELYGSMKSENDLISDATEYNFNIPTDRQLYAKMKYEAEVAFKNELDSADSTLNFFKVLRPFNVYGKNQKRGAMFEMVKSALLNNVIYYSASTVRTFTDIRFFSKEAAEMIVAEKSYSKNIADARCTLCMNTAARIVNDVLGLDCSLVEMPADKLVQYRQVSLLNTNYEEVRQIMVPHILDIAKQIRLTI